MTRPGIEIFTTKLWMVTSGGAFMMGIHVRVHIMTRSVNETVTTKLLMVTVGGAFMLGIQVRA